MNKKERLRPQVLATPYHLQDICPTKKLKAQEDTLRRIQKKIALIQKKELAENETYCSHETLITGKLSLNLEQVTVTPNRISKFERCYRDNGKQFYKVKEDNNWRVFEEEWLTPSDIFNKMALLYK